MYFAATDSSVLKYMHFLMKVIVIKNAERLSLIITLENDTFSLNIIKYVHIHTAIYTYIYIRRENLKNILIILYIYLEEF